MRLACTLLRAHTHPPATMADHQARPGDPPKGSQGSQPSSQSGKRQRDPSWTEAELRDLLGLWREEEVLQVMGSKRRNADAFARLAEGLATRGHPARTPDHVRSKVKELWQGYARAGDAAGRSGAAPITCPFYRELRDIVGPRHTTSPPATLDTSADKPQQAPESAPETSPAPQGPPQEPTPGAPEEEESSSSDGGLHIIMASRRSSQASAHWVSPDRGSGPSAAPLEGPESAGKESVVPDSPPRPSLQASPLAEDRPSPTAGKMGDPAPPPDGDGHPAAGHPSSAAGGRRAAAAGGGAPPPAAGAGAGLVPGGMGGLHADLRPYRRLPGPSCHAVRRCACPACSTHCTTHCAVRRRTATEGPSAEGDLGPVDTFQPYLPVCPAPSQPRPGLRPRRGSRLPTPSAGH
ncbi:uncharacterized protein LOC142015095 [Carettochelys insculpta]|uniref:uncharacterized protein LOC142015095 n=1 Tax=Carettochelys insculpta TaxID=44489 RepID=UPI003EB995CF